ncbi:N/A [soil metagenome]
MKVTTLIVDDEPVARAGLRAMLGAFDWVTVVGEAADGASAVEAIDRLRPELVFLDVQMPGLLGTEVVRRIQHQPFIIFTTAYSQHAVTAFEMCAVDYLLKPFGAVRLASALERVRSAVGEPAPASVLERLSGTLASGPITRLFVRTGGALIALAVANVSRFDAEGDYVLAYAEGKRHVLSLPLSRLEERLDPTRFVRVHRAHIVNLDHVRAFRPDARGNLRAELTDGALVPVSRSRAQALRRLGLEGGGLLRAGTAVDGSSTRLPLLATAHGAMRRHRIFRRRRSGLPASRARNPTTRPSASARKVTVFPEPTLPNA